MSNLFWGTFQEKLEGPDYTDYKKDYTDYKEDCTDSYLFPAGF
jgi:hypothetical protein